MVHTIEKTCCSCLYHTYKTSYIGYCRILKKEVTSIEINDCEDHTSNIIIGGVNEYKRD